MRQNRSICALGLGKSSHHQFKRPQFDRTGAVCGLKEPPEPVAVPFDGIRHDDPACYCYFDTRSCLDDIDPTLEIDEVYAVNVLRNIGTGAFSLPLVVSKATLSPGVQPISIG